jgi:enoyl-CoA hydratase/carnithine racemase
MPGGGGITKMTRLLGLMGAQPYVLESKLFGPAEAQQMGLVHALVDSDGRADARRSRLDRIGAGQRRGLPAPLGPQGYKMPGGTPSNPKPSRRAWWWPRHAQETTRGLYPAPRRRAGRHGRRRAGRFRHRDAHREPLPGRPDGQPGGEEHDQHVLLQPERDQERARADPEGRAALQASRRSASSAPA